MTSTEFNSPDFKRNEAFVLAAKSLAAPPDNSSPSRNTPESSTLQLASDLASLKKSLDSNVYHKVLLENMQDGVIYVDQHRSICLWSPAVEIMTGMSSNNICGRKFVPSLLTLADSSGITIPDDSCPLEVALRTGTTKTGDYKLIGRSGRECKVELTFAPVRQIGGPVIGAVVLVHDSSIQTDLKRQLRDLYEYSALDPLTQVANRAEFERVLDQFVQSNHTAGFQCSLIICDIDFFKSINDNYNHHIGDQALISFARLLKKFVRNQDIVARYGGEEFVILCADCDLAAAVGRAEEIRQTLTKTPQQMLDGKCITASFGVAELRSSDTATDLFVRADTALLKAKELGRNRVVEADAYTDDDTRNSKDSAVSSLGVRWRNFKGNPLVAEEFCTTTPMALLVEKLRGFIIESEAEIRRVEPDFATLLIQTEDPTNRSRQGNFIVDIEFQEREIDEDRSGFVGKLKKTYIRISIREGRKKWFGADTNDLAAIALQQLREYLAISNDDAKLKPDPVATESSREPAPEPVSPPDNVS